MPRKFEDLPHLFAPIGAPNTPETRLPGYQNLVHNDMAFVLALDPSIRWTG